MSYVLRQNGLQAKLTNWGHRNDVPDARKDAYYDLMDSIKTNKDYKNFHPVTAPLYAGMAYVQDTFNLSMYYEWVYELMFNGNIYDNFKAIFPKPNNTVSDKKFSISDDHRRFISAFTKEMIPSNNAKLLYVGTESGWGPILAHMSSKNCKIYAIDHDEKSYMWTTRNIIHADYGVQPLHGTIKQFVPVLENDSVDAAILNFDESMTEEVMRQQIIELWPKIKHYGIIMGMYPRKMDNVKPILNSLISKASQVQCPWGSELFNYYELYHDLFKDINKSKGISLNDDHIVWFARVRK
jgi:hypothetical protein